MRRIFGRVFLVAVLGALTPAYAQDGSYGCSFRWGINHDLGYCGDIQGSGSQLVVTIDNVRASSRGLGRPDACNGDQGLSSLRSGERITVPRHCLKNRYCLYKWGANQDLGYCAFVVPGGFSGSGIELQVDTVRRSRFGLGRPDACNDYTHLDTLSRGDRIRVSIGCLN